jgi:hypothetical protein
MNSMKSAVIGELRRAGRPDLAVAVRTFATRQDELDERSRRRGRQGAFTGDIDEIKDEVQKLGGIYDPTAKVWLLRDEDEVRKLAERHGFMMNWYARKDVWYLNAGVKIVGPKDMTMKLRGDLKRFHARWDGKNWTVPIRQLNSFRSFLEKKGVRFSYDPQSRRAGLAGVLTLQRIDRPVERRRGQKQTQKVGDVYDLDAVMGLIDSISKWPNRALLRKPRRDEVADWDVEFFDSLVGRLKDAAGNTRG